jgi:hypothetical protein
MSGRRARRGAHLAGPAVALLALVSVPAAAQPRRTPPIDRAAVERDATLARVRVLQRAGRLDSADAVLSAWTASHPADGEAWRTLGALRRRVGRERAAVEALARAQQVAPDARTARQLAAVQATAAPRVSTSARGSRDSDANTVAGATVAVDALAGDRVRVGLGVATRRTAYLGAAGRVGEATGKVTWRPRATLTLTGEVGAARLGAGPSSADTTLVITPAPTSSGNNGRGNGNGRGQGSSTTTSAPPVTTPLVVVHPGAASTTQPVARARARWRAGDGSALVDARLARAPLDATPALLANRVTRTDASLTAERRVVGPLRVRAIGQAARYEEGRAAAAEGTNARTTVGGGPFVEAGGVQLGLVALTSRWRRATTAGYFAPKRVDLGELALYAERELGARPVTIAVDAGAGAQRLTQHDGTVDRWSPAGRLWTQVAVPVGAASLTTELDLYQSQIAGDVATAAGNWRYAALSVGVRVPLR